MPETAQTNASLFMKSPFPPKTRLNLASCLFQKYCYRDQALPLAGSSMTASSSGTAQTRPTMWSPQDFAITIAAEQ